MEVFMLFFALITDDGQILSNVREVPSCEETVVAEAVKNEIDLISSLNLSGGVLYTCQSFTEEDAVLTGDPA
jgi:hypothetical protein